MRKGRCWTVIFIVICFYCCSFQHVKGSPDLIKVMNNMFDHYDRRVKPNDKPLEVEMSAYILDVYGIDEIRHEFSLSMYLRHHWTDERLQYSEGGDGVDKVLLDADHAKSLWIPDTFIVNQRNSIDSDFPEATIVYPDGSILRSTRISTTAACKYDLSYFPFDEQRCSVDFESYGHSASDFYYKWKGHSVKVADEGTNSRFRVAKVTAKDLLTALHGSNYSRFSVELTLVRSSGRYIVDVFFPIAALTLVSLLTLWMEEKKTRIQVSVLILVMMIIFTAISVGNLPKVSYQTALDAYIFFSFILVLIVVITNFTTVQTKWDRIGKQNECVELHQIQNDMDGSTTHLKEDHFKIGRPTFGTKTLDIFYFGFSKLRFLLPIIFISFNCAYWIAIVIGTAHYVKVGEDTKVDLHDE